MEFRSQLSRLRIHPFFVDVLSTGVTQVAVLAANFLLVGYVSRLMGVLVLGEYLLVKRASAWLATASQLGLNVALPREIAHTTDAVEERAKQFLAAALIVVLAFAALVGTLATLAANYFSVWCFGSERPQLVYALALLLVGTAVQTIVFGYFRGLQRVKMANLVSFVGVVLIPLLALLWTARSHSAPLLLGVTGLGMAAASLTWAAFILVKSRDLGQLLWRDARWMLISGVPRIPADLGFGALLVAGPMLASHYASMEQVSYLLVGATCLTMAGAALAPVSVVLLAKVSSLIGAGRLDDVNVYTEHLRSAVLQLSVVGLVQALVFIRPLVTWWLGPSCVPGIPIICTVLLAVPAYAYLVSMRSVVDAASTVAYNARNVLQALVVFAVLAAAIAWFTPREWVLGCIAGLTTCTMYLLVAQTHLTLRKLGMAKQYPQLGLVWAALPLGGVSLAAQVAFGFNIPKLVFCAVLLVNGFLALLLVRISEPAWVGFMRRIAMQTSSVMT